MKLASIKCTGEQNIASAYKKLISWATSTNLMNERAKMITIYFDSFKTTPPDLVNMCASMLVDTILNPDDEITPYTIEKGTFIVGHYELKMNELGQAWTSLFSWMNEHGYKKSKSHPFEMYHNNPDEHPDKKVVVDLFIPII